MDLESLNARRARLIIPIDRDIFESVLRLGDYVYTLHASEIVKSAFSLLLASLIVEDTQEAFDGFERLLVNYAAYLDTTSDTREKLFAEFTMVSHVFYERNRYSDKLKEELEELIPADSRTVSEELFEVRVSSKGPYIMIW